MLFLVGADQCAMRVMRRGRRSPSGVGKRDAACRRCLAHLEHASRDFTWRRGIERGGFTINTYSSHRIHLAVVLLAAAGTGIAQAQNYPTRPVRIVTATPGGGNDFLTRIIQGPLSAALNQTIIVDNRPSAFIGPYVARATPDGYTLVVGGGTLQYRPILEEVDYDLLKDFVPISQLERSPNVLVVNPSLKVNTVHDLIAMAKAKPKALRYGTGAMGGSLHLGGEMFMIATGTRLTRVPYKSTGPALLALLANETHMVFATSGGAMGHVRAGRLKALGVTSGKPFSLIPDIPTLASQGVKDYDLDTIGFLAAPAKTPPAIVKLINQHIVKIMQMPDVKEKMAAGGSEAVSSTPEEIAAYLKADDAKIRKLVRDIGLKPIPKKS